MKRVDIYLNGTIGEPDPMSFMWDPFEQFFTANDVRRMINENADATHLDVHITSRGGLVSEAYAIHDLLVNSGKEITTIAEGRVASAATIPLLAGKKRKMTQYAQLMIHNPWGSASGDADELQKAADETQKTEDQLAKFYADKTGHTEKEFDKWMKEETYMTAEEALQLGFITEVLQTLKAFALLKPNHSNQSSIMKTLKDMIAEQFSEIKAMITGNTATSKALDLTTADSRLFKVETDKGEAEVGDQVQIENAAPADGDYIIPSVNKVFSVAGGKISAIKDKDPESPATTGDEGDVDANALKASVKEKDEKIALLEAQNKAMAEDMKVFNKALEEVKGMIGSNYKPKPRNQNFNRATDMNSKNDAERDIAKDAKERRKTYKGQAQAKS